MIAVGEQEAAAEKMDGSVAERVAGAHLAKRRERRAVGKRTKREDNAQRRHRRNLVDEEWATGDDFRELGFVLRWHAAHAVGDPTIVQGDPIVRSRSVAARGEAKFDQRRVEQLASVVAREGPAGPVGTSQPGR